jgi:hypothetical protein
MKVQVILNYEDQNRRVRLIGDILEIDKDDFDSTHHRKLTKKELENV